MALSGAVVTARLHMLLPPSLHVENMTRLPVGGVAAGPGNNHVVIEAYRHAIATNFFAGSVLAALAFVVVLALPEMPLRARNKASVPAE